jgi:cytidine deaminase
MQPEKLLRNKSSCSKRPVDRCHTDVYLPRPMDADRLIDEAWQARAAAYAPYSGFAVGAALLEEAGSVFLGCNVENLSFGLTICAERAAVCAAIGAGARRFRMIAIVADSGEPISPCGACRQVLAEFAPDLEVVSANVRGERFTSSIRELLPRSKTGILDQPPTQCST